MNIYLLKIGIRYLLGHKFQSFLLILGIALGVALTISVDLANYSAKKAFRLSTETLTGKATHQIVSSSPSGINEELFRKIRIKAGIKKSAPIVQDYVKLTEANERLIKISGIDIFSEAPFRNYLADNGQFLSPEKFALFFTEPGTILISAELANSLQKKVGAKIRINYQGEFKELIIGGILETEDPLSKNALKDLLIADIATAQEVLQKNGYLSNIDLIIDQEKELEEIKNLLTPDLKIVTPAEKNATMEQMTRAFELNLNALSLLALVVGMFLIYNTVTFSIIRRRKIFGTLRALGVTRKEVFAAVIMESLLISLVGSVAGLFLGVLLGKGILQIIGQTINDLYFVVNVTQVEISVYSLAKGFFLGIFAGVFATLIPALEATFIPPVNALKRSELESSFLSKLKLLNFFGIIFLLGGLFFVLFSSKRIEPGFVGLFSIVIGSSLLIPWQTTLIIQGLQKISDNWLPFTARLALRNTLRSLSRTAVAIASLMVAVSVIIGVSIMVGSFRQNVASWLDTVLTADIFISANNKNNQLESAFSPNIVREIVKMEGIKETATSRAVKLETKSYGLVNLQAVSRDISKNRKYLWKSFTNEDVNAELKEGRVIVTESFSFHHDLNSGKNQQIFISLPTIRGEVKFPVAGVYRDYTSERGNVIIGAEIYKKYWQDEQVSALALNLLDSSKTELITEKLKQDFSGKYDLLIQSNQTLKKNSLEIFDRTFAITDALRLLTVIVAFIGVLSTIMAIELERIREIGILRANGMTVGQIFTVILFESGLIGLLSAFFAIPLGIIMSLILIYIINLRSFGWTLEFLPVPANFYQAILISIAASLAAGIYPALKIKKLKVIEAIRTE